MSEAFTGCAGVMVNITDTIRGFKMILDGEVDYLPESAFLNVVRSKRPSKRDRSCWIKPNKAVHI
jgi:F0F1-type ATP synthase beta subunit